MQLGETLSDKTVIIVDDYKNARFLIKMSLKQIGVNAIEAENGKEAISLVKQHPETELVLMDLNMPVLDGFQATKIIKEMRPDIKIIAVTAFSKDEDKERACKAGCDDIVTKPFDIAFLLSTVREFLSE